MLFFKINDRQYIELSPEREAGTDRLSHIAIETGDAEAMRAYLASRGVTVPEKRAERPDRKSEFHDQGPSGPQRGDRPIRGSKLDCPRARQTHAGGRISQAHDARRHHREQP